MRDEKNMEKLGREWYTERSLDGSREINSHQARPNDHADVVRAGSPSS